MKKQTNHKIYMAVLILSAMIPVLAAAEVIISFPLDSDPGWSTQGDREGIAPLSSVLFSDDFPSTTINPANWTVTIGVPTIDDVGIAEPSGPYSLRLNGDPSGGDSVESRVINLSGLSDGQVELRYCYEMRGGGEHPDPGEWLRFEYWNGSSWMPIHSYEGGGTDMTAYVCVTYVLPADALHAGFKLQIRNNGSSGSFDDWFVDDVRIIQLDDLSISPLENFESSGYEGGPFDPPSKIYTLTNDGVSAMEWKANSTQNWLDIDPNDGTLNPGGSEAVIVSLNAIANTMDPCTYSDTITFTDITGGTLQVRDVVLDIMAIPGEIEVTDSIPELNDLNMPFGEVIIGLARTEHITIYNTDPTYGLIISDILLNNQSVAPEESPELAITLPGVKGGSKDTTGLYIPPGWIAPDRPGTTLVVNSGYQALNSNMDILLLASGDDPTILRTALAAFPDIDTVDYFDCFSAVPTEVDLAPYDTVVVMANTAFADAIQTGDVLADYVDNGGKVIQAVATFAAGGWELAGRFVTGGYEPFTHGSPEFFAHSLGNFDTGHPIMDGITTLTDGLPVSMGLQGGAEWVADWDNGTPLVATQGQNVVGINMFVFDSGDYTGDVPLLFHNAIVWLAVQSAFELELPTGGLPITIPPSDSVTIDVDFIPTDEKLYESNVVIVSNDEDEPEVEVLLSGTGIADYLEIFPEEAIEFCGHLGGPFVPCSDEYRYRLTNNHTTENIGWTAALAVPWLDIWPESGELEPGESIYIWLSINAVGEGLPEGQYPGPSAIVFTDLFTTLEQPRDVNLEVLTAPKIWTTPDSFDVTVTEGDTLTETLTISNTGDAILNFNVTTHEILVEGPTEKTTISEPETGNEKVLPEYEFGKLVVSNKTFTEGPDSMATGDAPYKEGELIVRFAPRSNGKSASLVDKQQILDSSDVGTIKRDFNLVPGLSVVELPKGVTVQEAMQRLNNTGGILYVEPNYEIKLLSRIPNDTLFDELWGMHNTGQSGGTADADIDAPEAWDIATGNSSVVVALLDTGTDYNHIDLAANIWVNSGEIPDNGQDDDGNGYVDDVYGWDFADGDSDPMDYHYHGTHTAGTIGAIGDNSEGVAGVCWEVSIMVLKIFPNYGETAFVAGAIAAIEYAVDNGARLTSNSWGGGAYSQGLKDTIDDAGAAGLLFVAAAGNDYRDNDTYPHYPSSYDSDSIIAVMSTDHYDNMSSFSNYGPTSVDLGAPGSSILSCEPGNQYQYLNGTSMATPYVAGACALLWSVNPMLSSADLKNVLIETVDPTLASLCVSGGRLNLFNAISQMQAPWIEIEPDNGSAAPGNLNDVNVTFNATVLEPGVYEAEMVVASNDPLSPTIVIPVTMTVRPSPLEVIPEDGFEFNGYTGGPFAPGYQSFTLTNKNPVPLGWTVAVDVDWLSLTPQSGTLDPNESVMVDVWINENADTLERNEAGYIATVMFTNTIGGVSMHPVTLWVMEIDYFTELFESEDNDLDNQTLTFTRNFLGNFYDVCRQGADEFPVDPDGGTILSLEDDDYEQVILSAGVVSLYGEDFDSFFVGSNGYITFGIGDTQYVENLDNHFMFKRISGLFDDLSPNLGGQVSWKELPDRAVVTFENVPEYYVPGFQEGKTNNFQIELFFSGSIRITYLDILATDGLAGLSKGENTPVYFEESDLSGYYLCGDFETDGDVDIDDLVMLCERWLLGELSWDVSPDGGDGIVNFRDWTVFVDGWGSTNEMEDLIEFIEQWLQVGLTPTEIGLFDIAPTQRDGIINMLDYAVLAGNWLEGTVP